MKRYALTVAVGLTLVPAGNGRSHAQESRAQESSLAVMVFRGVQNLPLLAGQSKGFFAKRDLAVELKIAPSAAELPKGLAVAGR